MDKESKNFMVVTADNWLEVWSKGYSSREKAQLRVDEGYFLKYAMRELKDRRLQVITQLFCIPNILKNESNSQLPSVTSCSSCCCFVSQRY